MYLCLFCRRTARNVFKRPFVSDPISAPYSRGEGVGGGQCLNSARLLRPGGRPGRYSEPVSIGRHCVNRLLLNPLGSNRDPKSG